MLRHSKENKNKHQQYESVSDDILLYSDLPTFQKTHKRTSAKDEALLADDLYIMRRRFKDQRRRLKRVLDLERQAQDDFSADKRYRVPYLHPHHA